MFSWRPTLSALQAHQGLAAEQTVALAGNAGIQLQAVFQDEEGLQAVAEVLGAAKADARGEGAGQRRHLGDRVAGGIDVGDVGEAAVDDAIDLDAGLGLGRGGEAEGGQAERQRNQWHLRAAEGILHVVS